MNWKINFLWSFGIRGHYKQPNVSFRTPNRQDHWIKNTITIQNVLMLWRWLFMSQMCNILLFSTFHCSFFGTVNQLHFGFKTRILQKDMDQTVMPQHITVLILMLIIVFCGLMYSRTILSQNCLCISKSSYWLNSQLCSS